MNVDRKYTFSFTATSLRTPELVEVAKWDDTGDTKELELSLGNGKSSTGKRMLRELRKRLDVLTQEQIDLLITGSREIQTKLAYLSVCKYYDFIREFVLEVVREKYLLFDYELTDGDYLSFFRRKSYEDDSLEELTELTLAKIKQVVFKILEQAGIIDNVTSRTIQPQLPDDQLIKVINDDNKELLKFFLFSDLEIQSLTQNL